MNASDYQHCGRLKRFHPVMLSSMAATMRTASAILLLLSSLATTIQSDLIERKVCWSSCGQQNAIQVPHCHSPITLPESNNIAIVQNKVKVGVLVDDSSKIADQQCRPSENYIFISKFFSCQCTSEHWSVTDNEKV